MKYFKTSYTIDNFKMAAIATKIRDVTSEGHRLYLRSKLSNNLTSEGQDSLSAKMKYFKKRPQTPKSRELGGKGVRHLAANIGAVSDILPHSIRRPGAMPLYVLKGDIVIKGKSGT